MQTVVRVTNGTMEQTEMDAYVDYVTRANGRAPAALDITIDGDDVDLCYEFEGKPFQRIRRITGYLVGTLDRFNDGKRHEEHDRVKHTL